MNRLGAAVAILLGTIAASAGESGISFEGLLRFAVSYKGDAAGEAMVVRLIEMYGLDFRPTPEDLAKLRGASASDALLKAVRAARMPVLPPKPVVKDGHLAVVCEPVDCDVRLNGAPAGTTRNGVLPVMTLPQGPVTVSAVRASYDAVQAKQEALIWAGEIARVEFHFKPSHEALASAGAALLQRMCEALDAAGAGVKTFRAKGTVYLQDRGGHRTAWTLTEWLQSSDSARFEFARLRERYEITQSAAGFVWKKRPKIGNTQETLEEMIRLLAEYRFASVVDEFRSPGMTAVAADLAFGIDRPAAFRVESGATAWAVTLDAANRPSEIRVEPSARAASLRIVYSDYVQQEGLSYPMTTQIIRPDGVSGIEARLEFAPADPAQTTARKRRLWRR
jgi:hypothetical protein